MKHINVICTLTTHAGDLWATSRQKLSSGLWTRQVSNRPSQLQRLARVLESLNLASVGIIVSRERTTKALNRLRTCAGWSVPLLFAYDKNVFSHDVTHIMAINLLIIDQLKRRDWECPKSWALLMWFVIVFVRQCCSFCCGYLMAT